jgi:hypothetical protein
MEQFLNWRWYRGLGGGPIVDLGSHQIDIFNWFLETKPTRVVASGGTDYYSKATHEWYDTVMAVFEYPTKAGIVRAFYQTGTTNGFGGYYELFLGDQGSLEISESGAQGQGLPRRGERARLGVVREAGTAAGACQEPTETKRLVLDVRETEPPPSYALPVQSLKLYHQPHLENFFDAIRGKARLTCPGEIGYETAVTVLKVNEAVEANGAVVRNQGFRVLMGRLLLLGPARPCAVRHPAGVPGPSARPTAGPPAAARRHSDGSRARPVHVIPLRDHEGEVIRPTDRPLLPFSTSQTCGADCHDVATVERGWHFRTERGRTRERQAG